jgi:ring-1,2-phenylacetyl-CoA epoxidase subunit PaaD
VTPDATLRDRVSEDAVWKALEDVPDPEIPGISVVELGIIRKVEISDRVRVEVMPTFVGCPALDVVQDTIRKRLEEFGPTEVKLTFAEPWTSERITPEGREKLRRSGFAPPPAPGEAGSTGPLLQIQSGTGDELCGLPALAECPHCGSRSTRLESPFGPTLCRAVYHCADCRQPFEQFKPV